MRTPIDRREFLAVVAGAVAVGALPSTTRAQTVGPSGAVAQEPSDALNVEKLGDALIRIGGAGANVTVARANDDLLMVDGGLARRSEELLKLVAEQWPDARVATLFNTNWRPEHTGSNAALRSSGARILAHENTKLWLGGDFFVEWEDRAYKPNPAAALPTETFYTSGKLELEDEEVEYGHLPRAHTDGDMYLLFRRSNVLVASDVLSVGRYPVVDYSTGGWIGGLEQATKMLLDLSDGATKIVPAVGAVQARAALEAQLRLCTAVRQRVAEAFRNGMSLKDFTATRPTGEFDAQYGDPSQFLPLVYKGAFGHIRELGGTI